MSNADAILTAATGSETLTVAPGTTAGPWRFECGVTGSASMETAYSDTPSHTFTGLAPGRYRATVVRVSADKTQELGAVQTTEFDVAPDVTITVDVATGVTVQVIVNKGGTV